MKNKILYGLLLIFTASIVLYTLFSILNERKNSEIISLLADKKIIDSEERSRTLEKMDIYTLKSISKEIYKDDIDSLKLLPHTIYLRIHQNMCLACYTSTINNISDKIKNMPMVGSYDYISSFNSIVKEFCFLDTVKSKNNLHFLNKIPADSLNKPYLFTINEKNRINSLFFLEKENTEERIELYIKIINNLK